MMQKLNLSLGKLVVIASEKRLEIVSIKFIAIGSINQCSSWTKLRRVVTFHLTARPSTE